MLKFRQSKTSFRPRAVFYDEPEPRNWLLSGMLDDHFYEEDIAMFLDEIAKAEAGEPNVVIGNHEVWVKMSADRVILEEMLYGDDKINGTVPKQTELSLAECKRLVLEWREAVKRWYAEHPRRDAPILPN
ncbi:hypothetical protein [Haliangium sp. UPWRP_2]|uniref:hypothetical protein n=1 Tax=Haliangium sp. UPWRP_2 TaxID=1931276 RepID=UPI0011B1FAF0|nr:hypothetical protein [Haliangium sp. UPWRP_2]